MKLFRIILAAPFVLLGAGFYGIAELVSGEIYARHTDIVERNMIFKHKMHQANMQVKRGSNRMQGKKNRKWYDWKNTLQTRNTRLGAISKG